MKHRDWGMSHWYASFHQLEISKNREFCQCSAVQSILSESPSASAWVISPLLTILFKIFSREISYIHSASIWASRSVMDSHPLYLHIGILYQTSYDKESPNCWVTTSNVPSDRTVIMSIWFFAACLSKVVRPRFAHMISLICRSGTDGECLQKHFPCSTRLAQRQTTSPEGRVIRR